MTQKRDTSREYVFKGTLALRNVTFYVEAKDENEAKLNAINGKYVRWEAASNRGW